MPKNRLRATIVRASAVCLMVLAFSASLGAQLPLPPPPPPPAWLLAKVDPLLLEQLANGSGQSYVIVRAQSAGVVGAVSGLITAVGGTLGRNLPILTARAARVPNSVVLLLAANPLIQRIALDRLTLGFNERTSATVGADVVRQQLGYDGSGIGVAVIDSGVTNWHDDLADENAPTTQRVDQFVDFVGNQSQRYDDYGHGTHVAGIIAGNGADSNGARTGIAPKARLIVLKVLDGNGRGRISDVIAALDYAVAHQSEFNIRVINMSIGAGVYESYNSDFLTLAAKRVVEAGIVVVAAAGNHGRNDDGVEQHGAISAPGNAPWVITVGASSHMGTTSRADDTMAAFSSRGPTAYDFAAKPDLVAPGVGIYSLSSPGSTLYDRWPEARLPGDAGPEMPYFSLSGTSQAAPVVTGTVALMLQANPSLTPNAVKAILQYTAEMYAGNSYLAQGAGFLNARGAVDLALSVDTPPAERAPSPSEWSRQIIWGNNQVQGGDLVSTANAWATTVAWGAAADAGNQLVTWGESCSGTECGTGGSGWSNWGASCSGTNCETIVWGSEQSMNIVWGDTCDGVDCEDTLWATSDDDIIVWGNSDGDIVVWGNSGDDIVVWGNSDDDIIVWGNSGEDPDSAPVIWPQ